MKDIENKLAAFLMEYGVLKNADADKMARKIAGMFEKEGELGDLKEVLKAEQEHRLAVESVRDALQSERDQLAAKCAEMREALTEILGVVELLDYDETRYWTNLITHALSNSCGKGWISPEKAERLREGLDKLLVHAIEFYNDWKKGDFALCELAECDMESMAEQFNRAKQALEETK